jgi:prophage regulatory protein
LIGPTVTEDKQRKRQAHSRPRENHENLEDEPLTASVNLFAKSSNRQTNEAVTQSRVKKSPEIDLKPQDNKPTIIRIKQVQERTGLSRSTIYERMNQKSPRHDQTFPKQVNLGLGSVGWYESEISKWIDARRK